MRFETVAIWGMGLLGGSWQIDNYEGKVRLSINAPIDGGALQ